MEYLENVKRMAAFEDDIEVVEYEQGLWFLKVKGMTVMSSRIDDKKTLDIMAGWIAGYIYRAK